MPKAELECMSCLYIIWMLRKCVQNGPNGLKKFFSAAELCSWFFSFADLNIFKFRAINPGIKKIFYLHATIYFLCIVYLRRGCTLLLSCVLSLVLTGIDIQQSRESSFPTSPLLQMICIVSVMPEQHQSNILAVFINTGVGFCTHVALLLFICPQPQ